jgi:hypothetical protein
MPYKYGMGERTLISTDEKARVAVLSLCWASSKAAVFKAATVRTSSGEANERATEAKRREVDVNIFVCMLY